MKQILQKIDIEYGWGRYGFFEKLWSGVTHRSISHWLIMAVALVPLLLVQQVSRSMIEGIALRMIETDSYHLLFQPYQDEYLANKQNRLSKIQELNAIDGIENAFDEVRGIGIIRKGTQKTGISIRGVSNNLLHDPSFSRYITVIEGSLELSSKNDVVLGKAVAKKLNVEIGDTILLLTTRSSNINALPKISKGKVSGIISTGYQELDKGWVFTTIERAEEIIPIGNQHWYIGMKLADPFAIRNGLVTRSDQANAQGQEIMKNVEKAIYKLGQLHTWYSVNYSKFSLFVDTKRVLSMVMFIAVMLAAITLSSTMSMKVIDLEVDIAMLKGIGADPRKLERQVFIQGLRYGTIGSFIGGIIGIMLTAQINNLIFLIDIVVNLIRRIFGYTNPISILNPEYYLSEIPFRLYPLDMLYVILSAIILSIIAAWIPARRLRKVSALKIIRRH